jgi:hypothetical protein
LRANATFGDELAATRQAKASTSTACLKNLVDVGTVKIWERSDMPHANRIQMLLGVVERVYGLAGPSARTAGQVVLDTFEIPVVNDALGEISQLKATLSGAVEKTRQTQERLLAFRKLLAAGASICIIA